MNKNTWHEVWSISAEVQEKTKYFGISRKSSFYNFWDHDCNPSNINYTEKKNNYVTLPPLYTIEEEEEEPAAIENKNDEFSGEKVAGSLHVLRDITRKDNKEDYVKAEDLEIARKITNGDNITNLAKRFRDFKRQKIRMFEEEKEEERRMEKKREDERRIESSLLEAPFKRDPKELSLQKGTQKRELSLQKEREQKREIARWKGSLKYSDPVEMSLFPKERTQKERRQGKAKSYQQGEARGKSLLGKGTQKIEKRRQREARAHQNMEFMKRMSQDNFMLKNRFEEKSDNDFASAPSYQVKPRTTKKRPSRIKKRYVVSSVHNRPPVTAEDMEQLHNFSKYKGNYDYTNDQI